MVTETSAGTLSASLDELAHAIRSGSVAAGVEGLVDSLDHHRQQVSAEEWPSIVRSVSAPCCTTSWTTPGIISIR